MMGHSRTSIPRLSVASDANDGLLELSRTPHGSFHEHESSDVWALRTGVLAPKKAEKKNQNERTVVMLGLTGHGKSQLIKSMFRLFKHSKEAQEIGVGDGNVSTTSAVKCHSMLVAEISTPTLRERDIKEWQIKHGKKTMDHHDEMKMFAGNERWCADYYLHEYKADIKYSKKKMFRLNMIDVPGGSDSKGRDDWNFFELAKYLVSCGGVAAFVFAVMHKRVFDEDFQRFFNYYWDWLSAHGVPFIMVHTGWDPFLPHYDDKITARTAKFLETFPKAGSVKHIFIDTVWNEEGDEDYEEDVAAHDQQKKALAVASVNELIVDVFHRPTMSLDKLHFLKTPCMKSLDSVFKTAAETGRSHLADPMQNIDSALGEIVSTLAEMKQRKTEAQLLVDPISTKLSKLDNDELVRLEEHEGGACYLWGWKTVEFTTKYPIAELQTVAHTTATWDKVKKDGCWATGRVSSGGCPRFIWGSIVAYATSRVVNSEAIQKLKEELRPALKDLHTAEKDFERESTRSTELGHQLEGLTLQLRKQDLVIRVCSWPSMTPAVFAKLFPIYESCKKGTKENEMMFSETLWDMKDELMAWEAHHEVDTDRAS